MISSVKPSSAIELGCILLCLYKCSHSHVVCSKPLVEMAEEVDVDHKAVWLNYFWRFRERGPSKNSPTVISLREMVKKSYLRVSITVFFPFSFFLNQGGLEKIRLVLDCSLSSSAVTVVEIPDCLSLAFFYTTVRILQGHVRLIKWLKLPLCPKEGYWDCFKKMLKTAVDPLTKPRDYFSIISVKKALRFFLFLSFLLLNSQCLVQISVLFSYFFLWFPNLVFHLDTF